MGGGNVLLDEDLQLVGVLDFNLSGRETALNMLFRESFVNFEDDEKNMLYDGQLQEKAFTLFIENLQIIKNITRSTRRKQTPRRCSTAICALSGGIRSGP